MVNSCHAGAIILIFLINHALSLSNKNRQPSPCLKSRTWSMFCKLRTHCIFYTNHGLSPCFINHRLSSWFKSHGPRPCFTNHGLSLCFPGPFSNSVNTVFIWPLSPISHAQIRHVPHLDHRNNRYRMHTCHESCLHFLHARPYIAANIEFRQE